MLYIHHTSCISPQQTFGAVDINRLHDVVNNKLQVIEPSYEGIPTGILRRMGKAIRMGVGAALSLLKSYRASPDGIIIGTADGGMEDCIKFLNQIIDYEEGMLTPTNFVQSTTNAIAAQVALLTNNKQYNATHVHRGLSFENALLDADMLAKESRNTTYLVGGVDEISAYNYNIDYLNGWYKKEPLSAKDLYNKNTAGSIAGEGAAMFLVNNFKADALAQVTGICMIHTANENDVAEQLKLFLAQHLTAGKNIDILLSGENGDNRLQKFYEASGSIIRQPPVVARFKHMTGEYATATAAALWLACYILQRQSVPEHMLRYMAQPASIQSILISNNFKGQQHSFILVESASV